MPGTDRLIGRMVVFLIFESDSPDSRQAEQSAAIPTARRASPSPAHTRTDFELRRAYVAAKHLAEILTEILEVCALPDLNGLAIAIRLRISELRNELAQHASAAQDSPPATPSSRAGEADGLANTSPESHQSRR